MANVQSSGVKKIWRYLFIYGIGKTVFKIMGRLRPRRFSIWSRKRDLGIIGCGQYAYSSVGHAIWSQYGNRFVDCFDVNSDAQQSFAALYGTKSDSASGTDVINNPDAEYIYVASNHASHTDYAVEALNAGKTVYVEKPISVSLEQLQRLSSAMKGCSDRIYAGYNRPFSKAVNQVRQHVTDPDLPISYSAFVTGHVLDRNHWYLNPEEGTRICSNVIHWIDLAVHMMLWGSLPDEWKIKLTYSDADIRDENMAINMTSSRGDLINIMFTTRGEPFEGVAETICFQQGDVIAKIHDFRRMKLWKGDQVKKYRYFPKDIGHNAALVQPFLPDQRDWTEIFHSNLLMVRMAEMVVNGETECDYSFAEAMTQLDWDSAQG